jgi:hypothetical protein
VVTASGSVVPKGQFRETGSIICGYKQKAAAIQKQNVDVKDKVIAGVHKTKKAKNKTKTKAKAKTKAKRKEQS